MIIEPKIQHLFKEECISCGKNNKVTSEFWEQNIFKLGYIPAN